MAKEKKIIFFDTETTGNTTEDYLCQLAYKTGEEIFTALYKPPVKIPPEASAVHHISNKMVADKPAFQDSEDYKKIKKLFEAPDTVMVAHNAPFDFAMMKREDIEPTAFIDTLRVARHLDKEEKIERFNLQYLRYLLEIEIDAPAHDALGDVLVLEQFYERLLKKVMEEENCSEAEAIEKMIEISSHPSLLRTIGFGKHRGKKVAEVADTDRNYLEWLLSEKLKDPSLDEDWIYTLKYYLEK